MEKATLATQSSTGEERLHLALELSAATWKLGFSDGKRIRIVSRASADWRRLGDDIAQARKRFGLPDDVAVASCYEAGRDGFWIDRYLTHLGVDNVVVEPASIRVNRRARRAKTDRLDVRALLGLLVRHATGEQGVWSVVRVPDEEAEDARRPHRERERLTKERTQHRARLQALLVLEGIRLKPGSAFLELLEHERRWDGSALPEHLHQELIREYRRLELVEEQLAALAREVRLRVARAETAADRKIATLATLRGVGLRGASVLVGEFFGWRQFRNRREVGSLAGMDGTPYNSGDSERDQGISKAGNRRVRTLMVELAWGWLRWQPQSKLARWFAERTGPSGKRHRRVMIVAVARRLLIDLWHFVEHGVVPQGAIVQD